MNSGASGQTYGRGYVTVTLLPTRTAEISPANFLHNINSLETEIVRRRQVPMITIVYVFDLSNFFRSEGKPKYLGGEAPNPYSPCNSYPYHSIINDSQPTSSNRHSLHLHRP